MYNPKTVHFIIINEFMEDVEEKVSGGVNTEIIFISLWYTSMDKLSCYIYTGRLRYIRDLVAVWILHIGIYIFFPRPLDTYVHAL